MKFCKVEGDYIVRFVSPHPRDFTDDVIDVIAKNDKISKCLPSTITIRLISNIKKNGEEVILRKNI